MGAFSDVPGLVSTGNISPYRFVKADTSADNSAAQASAVTDKILGVTDQSTRQFDSAYHAISGDPITLQGGDVVLIEVGASVTRGALLQPDSNGKAITAVTTATGAGVTNSQPLVALESGGADGVIIRAFWSKNTTAYN